MRTLIGGVLGLMLCGVANAGVAPATFESQAANYMFNGCTAQTGGMSLQAVLKLTNPKNDKEVTKLVTQGYKLAIDYPNTGCNQIFITVIDNLVTSRSKI